jgi:hypothetical protein
MEDMMFTLKVTEDEIQKTLEVMKQNVYPNSASLLELAFWVFDYAMTYDIETGMKDITEIDLRKVRLCIAELRKRGVLIIAKRGYSIAGDDPEPAIHFLNGLYSRAHNLTKEADIMYHGIKQKYGDEVAKRVVVPDGQPFLGASFHTMRASKAFGEPAFQK